MLRLKRVIIGIKVEKIRESKFVWVWQLDGSMFSK